MKKHVYIASDHGGFSAKAILARQLKTQFEVTDLGPDQLDPTDDYPLFAEKVARAVVSDPGSFGILVCRSGEGMEIAANKIAGIRASIAWNEKVAVESRKDNDSNLLSLPADFVDSEELVAIAKKWLVTEFSRKLRHDRRIKQIADIEDDPALLIAPAILEQNLTTFKNKFSQARQLSDRIQIDIIDGEFANNTTINLNEIEPVPGYKLDIDLMVARPSQWLNQCARLKPNLVIVHVEINEDISSIIDLYTSHSIKIGLAINPATKVDAVLPYIDRIDHVLIMGVEAGFSHQSFDSNVLLKPSMIRDVKSQMEIGIDGGINSENLPAIKQAGVNIAYVNSALFDSDSPIKAFVEMVEHV